MWEGLRVANYADAIRRQEKAKEDAYFAKKERELIEQLRKRRQEQEKPARSPLKQD